MIGQCWDIGQLAGAINQRVRRENLFLQRLTRPRQAQDKNRRCIDTACAAVLCDKLCGKCVDNRIDQRLKLIGIPGHQFFLTQISCSVTGKRIVPLLAMFIGFAECVIELHHTFITELIAG